MINSLRSRQRLVKGLSDRQGTFLPFRETLLLHFCSFLRQKLGRVKRRPFPSRRRQPLIEISRARFPREARNSSICRRRTACSSHSFSGLVLLSARHFRGRRTSALVSYELFFPLTEIKKQVFLQLGLGSADVPFSGV